jgi:hypothetical protein
MTTSILQILVSPRPTSISRRVARAIGERVSAQRPCARVIERDLAADPPPHPDLELYEAILSPTPDDDPRFVLSEQMIAELEAGSGFCGDRLADEQLHRALDIESVDRSYRPHPSDISLHPRRQDWHPP